VTPPTSSGDCVASTVVSRIAPYGTAIAMALDMIYLPPTSIVPFANGVPETTIVIGAPILIALVLALAVCLGAIVIGAVAARRSRRHGTVRWPAIIVTAGGALARRRAREA